MYTTLRWRLFAALIIVSLFGLPARSSGATDVPAGHWSYSALEDLAANGLLKGYPKERELFAGRVCTRYELAAITQRALQTLVEVQLGWEVGTGGNPNRIYKESQKIGLLKLVDEYKVELTVIGADIEKSRLALSALKPEAGPVVASLEPVSLQKRSETPITDSFMQKLQETNRAIQIQAGRIDSLTNGKVQSGFGKMRINGLLQVWGVGDSANFDSGGQGSTGRLRRVRVRFTGDITPRSYYTIMLDGAHRLRIDTQTSNGAVTGLNVFQGSTPLVDAVGGFVLAPGLALEVGQQKVPQSYEALKNPATLLTIERSIMNILPINNGRIGVQRETGAMLRYASKPFEAQLAVLQDGGNRMNNSDDNNAKEIMWHAHYKLLHNFGIGMSQAISGGVDGASRALRHRLGFEAVFKEGRHTLEMEYAQGRDGMNPVRSFGGYMTYAYMMNKNWELVFRGDYWNPNRGLKGADSTDRLDLLVGANWYIAGNNTKIQFNYIHSNVSGPMNPAGTASLRAPFLGRSRSIFMTSFQQLF